MPTRCDDGEGYVERVCPYSLFHKHVARRRHLNTSPYLDQDTALTISSRVKSPDSTCNMQVYQIVQSVLNFPSESRLKDQIGCR